MTSPLEAHDPKQHGWSRLEAGHLLRRCAWGASEQEVDQCVADGPEATVDRFLATQEESEEFRQTEQLLHRAALASGKIDQLKHWWLYRLLHSANPLTEKMTLFWHNHFATSDAKVRSTAKMDAQHALFREQSLGNFATLFRAIARDPAMLVWLDGNANRKRHPNENFAREVMELFSLGVGNYSETDIKEAARAFSGWHLRNDRFWFNRSQHDSGSKTVLGKAGPFKGDDILELCLAQPACPRFLARKLLETFLRPDPQPALVDALAQRLRAHDFEVAPVLRELLLSRTFFADDSRATLIKSPVDLVVGTFRSFGGRAHLANCVQLLSDLGQNLFEPPTVKGWEGGRLWINSATMVLRANFAAALVKGDRFGSLSHPPSSLTTPAAFDRILSLLIAIDPGPPARRELHRHLRSGPSSDPAATAGLLELVLSLPEYQLA